jgi:hypothetical protein
MSEPVPVDAARFFEFIDRSGLAVLLVSVHPRHNFSPALSQRLSAEHQDIALGTINLVDLVTLGGPALPFLDQAFRACGVTSAFGVLPGYCLFRQAEMLAWDAGLPAAADADTIGRSALVGLVFSSITNDLAFVRQAVQWALDQVAAHRVAARFRDAAAERSYRRARRQETPPPVDEVRWAYDVLGVQSTATDREVHQAWRRRRIEMHPDSVAGDPIEFERRSRISVEINRARDIIVGHRSRRAGEARAA